MCVCFKGWVAPMFGVLNQTRTNVGYWNLDRKPKQLSRVYWIDGFEPGTPMTVAKLRTEAGKAKFQETRFSTSWSEVDS